MRKLPSNSVDVRYFFPVREFDALMLTPGRGVLPDFTTPVISPKAEDAALAGVCGDGLACGEAGAPAVSCCAGCSCRAWSASGRDNTAKKRKNDQTRAN